MAEQLFALSVGVTIRGIDQIAALLYVTVEHLPGYRRLTSPTPLSAERHRAQGQWTYSQPGPSQCDVLFQTHRKTSMFKLDANELRIDSLFPWENQAYRMLWNKSLTIYLARNQIYAKRCNRESFAKNC